MACFLTVFFTCQQQHKEQLHELVGAWWVTKNTKLFSIHTLEA